MTLQLAISELQTQLALIATIKKAPALPPDGLVGSFPFLICYPSSGTFTNPWAGNLAMEARHDITLELHTSRTDLKRDITRSIGYGETITNAISWHIRQSTFTYIINYESIDYVFGQLEWMGTTTFGYRFNISGVRLTYNIAAVLA